MNTVEHSETETQKHKFSPEFRELLIDILLAAGSIAVGAVLAITFYVVMPKKQPKQELPVPAKTIREQTPIKPDTTKSRIPEEKEKCAPADTLKQKPKENKNQGEKQKNNQHKISPLPLLRRGHLADAVSIHEENIFKRGPNTYSFKSFNLARNRC